VQGYIISKFLLDSLLGQTVKGVICLLNINEINYDTNANAMTTASTAQQKIIGKSVAYGALGGIIAGLVMSLFMMLTATSVGMPADTLPKAMGLMFGATMDNAVMAGFGMHILTSTLIGMIFGFVTSTIKKLNITSMGKGISEGVITGVIALAVPFLPVSMAMMPPVLMQMMISMNPGATQQQVMGMMQQGMPTMMGIGIIEHLVYGAILGTIASALVLREARKSNIMRQLKK
jgi:uncharacterized membrane protein YeaQ/YmgE (transglycosylase-associated protein family)